MAYSMIQASIGSTFLSAKRRGQQPRAQTIVGEMKAGGDYTEYYLRVKEVAQDRKWSD
jgi:hypothetical protein